MTGARRADWTAGVAAISVGLVCTGPPPSAALEPPRSGLSTALLTPVPLLDDDANTFLFPHLGADLEPAVFAYAGTGASLVSASGARIRAMGQTFHYQSLNLPRDTASRLVDRFQSPFYQAGWATRFGPLRIGASFTWSTDSARQTRRGFRELISGRNEVFDSDFQGVDVREGAFSVGWTGPATVDAVLELCSERLHFDDTSLTRTLDLSLALAERESVTMEGDGIRPGGAVRLTVPLGERRTLRLLARARDAGQDLERSTISQLSRNGVVVVDSMETRAWDSSGSEVSAGFLVESTRVDGTRWAAHGFCVRVRSAWRYRLVGSSGSRTLLRSDLAELGCSLRASGPAGLEILSGLGVTYSDSRERVEDRFTGDRGIVVRLEDAHQETRAAMAWGARRTVRRIELAATLRTFLLFSNPIASLDIRVPF